jgi:hypothetical protein
MAISWLSVLQAVPWSDVISNAPKVAEGARKLWKSVGARGADEPTEPAVDSTAAAGPTLPPDQALLSLQGRVRALESALEGLRGQLQQSSELINALAEQNAQLVQRIELNRQRLQRTLLLAVAATALAVAALGWIALR